MSQRQSLEKCLVKVVHSYQPRNNDELQMEVGDIVTLTQKEDGGWWEGSLNGHTGWFPSNYTISVDSTPPEEDISNEKKIEYRRMVISDLIESEAAYISELKSIWENFLQPKHLSKAEILMPDEYSILVGNLEEVENFAVYLLDLIKVEELKDAKDQRIGKIFLENAPKTESILKIYCSNHPKAVQVIEKNKEVLGKYMEGRGATKPGELVLIMSLSQPFRRLAKYPTMLKELERHVEEHHKDRGDIQRSIYYYKEIEKDCSDLRKRKEMEFEVLNGSIKNWEGSSISQLGEILYMNLVFIGTELIPRYFVLFANTLLILSHDSDNNALSYEGKIPISGTTLTSIKDTDFEIAGPMIDTITVHCNTKKEKDVWVDYLSKILRINRFPSFSSTPHQSIALTPPVQAWSISRLRPAPPYNPFLEEHLQAQVSSNNNGQPQSPAKWKNSTTSQNFSNTYFPADNFTNTNLVSQEDNFAILHLVDSFCSKNRIQSSVSLTQSAALFNNGSKPVSLLINNNKPIIIPEKSKPTKVRTLGELVLNLREEVITLKSSIQKLGSQLDEEQRARREMENRLASNGSNKEDPKVA